MKKIILNSNIISQSGIDYVLNNKPKYPYRHQTYGYGMGYNDDQLPFMHPNPYGMGMPIMNPHMGGMMSMNEMYRNSDIQENEMGYTPVMNGKVILM